MFLKKINWNVILLILIILLGVLFLYQRNRSQNFKYKYQKQVKETNRYKNNFAASKDTLKIIKKKNGNLTAEISGYKLTMNELNNEYKELFKLYEYEKDKPPKYITETKYIMSESITEIPTEVEGDSLINFSDSLDYGNGNWRIIKSTIPYDIIYRIKKDSVYDIALNDALRYSFELQRRGLKDSRVIIYDGNNRVNQIKKTDSLNYRIQFFETEENIDIEQISDRFNIDKKDIYKSFENDKFRYMTGLFVPKKNVEPLIDETKLNNYAVLNTFDSKTDLQISMNLSTALFEDKETGKLKLQVNTDYPGITFKDLKGAEIISKIKDEKINRNFRKEWSIGLHFGFGGMILPNNNEWNIKKGPVISIGINYNPKFLQFGSSKNTLDILNF